MLKVSLGENDGEIAGEQIRIYNGYFKDKFSEMNSVKVNYPEMTLIYKSIKKKENILFSSILSKKYKDIATYDFSKVYFFIAATTDSRYEINQ